MYLNSHGGAAFIENNRDYIKLSQVEYFHG